MIQKVWNPKEVKTFLLIVSLLSNPYLIFSPLLNAVHSRFRASLGLDLLFSYFLFLYHFSVFWCRLNIISSEFDSDIFLGPNRFYPYRLPLLLVLPRCLLKLQLKECKSNEYSRYDPMSNLEEKWPLG